MTGTRRRDDGQVVVLFAFTLVAVVAMAALLIDGGLAWSSRREAQAAADTAALAAASAALTVGATNSEIVAAGRSTANANGYPTDLVTCDGTTQTGDGVVVNWPPTSGDHVGDSAFVEVITTRAMRTTFAGAIGQPCWLVSARAVAAIAWPSVANCSFCSLNDSDKNHTLVLKNGATLRVDGDIYVNSSNGIPKEFDGTTCTAGKGIDSKTGEVKNPWYVCGDGFDVFGDGGYISAQTISVVGGWETHDQNVVVADGLAQLNGADCPLHTDAPGQAQPSNVCIGMPVMPDPLNDPANPQNMISPPSVPPAPVAGSDGCPVDALIPTGTEADPTQLSVTSGSGVLCPGTYYGGISITGTASVAMLPGVYYLAGGGFTVLDSASVAADGVMLYNSDNTAVPVNTNPGVDLVPPPDPAKLDPHGVKVDGNPKSSVQGQAVVFTFTADKAGKEDPGPTGQISFFDGETVIPGCENLTGVPNGTKLEATCTVTFPVFGTHAIAGVYYGDSVYNAAGASTTYTISPPSGSEVAPINITTTGDVRITGMTVGDYRGMTIYQPDTAALTITLSPGSGSAPACPADFMTADPPPTACGGLGGLQGTVYAPNDDALVYVTSSGLANLQLIAGKIQIDNNVDTRFAYTPQFFANGGIRLIE